MAMVYGDTAATGNTPVDTATPRSPTQQLVTAYGIPKDHARMFTSYKKFKKDLQWSTDVFLSGSGE